MVRPVVHAKIMIRYLFLLSLFSFGSFAQQALSFKQADIVINQISLQVEYADTRELRNRGLMYRKSMCDDCGMLFNFQYEYPAGMWMKNTFIALDVAFIKANGEISDIKPMQPHDLTTVGASTNVLYALEMNQGWFAEHGIRIGDKLTIEKVK